MLSPYLPFQDKVDVVKMTMQDNIQQMLANEERLDQISENAENLNEQACCHEMQSAHSSIAGSHMAVCFEATSKGIGDVGGNWRCRRESEILCIPRLQEYCHGNLQSFVQDAP